MAKRKTEPAAATRNCLSGRETLEAVCIHYRALPSGGDPFRFERTAGGAADQALTALAAGDLDLALYFAFESGFRSGVAFVDIPNSEAIKTGWLHKRLEASRREKLAGEFKQKLDKAIERFLQLRNNRGDKKDPTDFYLRKKAAAEAKISEKSLRKYLPESLR